MGYIIFASQVMKRLKITFLKEKKTRHKWVLADVNWSRFLVDATGQKYDALHSQQHSPMFCCQHCSMLSTILFSIVEPELAYDQV